MVTVSSVMDKFSLSNFTDISSERLIIFPSPEKTEQIGHAGLISDKPVH